MFQYFKRFGRQVITYGLGDTINKVIGIIIVPIFTRYLTPADYGVAGVLTVANSLLIGICDLGLSNGIARFFHEQDQKQRPKLISTAMWAMVAVSLVIALLIWPFAGQISQFLFKDAKYAYILMLSLFTVPLTMATLAPLMKLRLEEKAAWYASFNVARVVTGLALNVIFIVFLQRGLNGLFEAPLINAAIYFVVIMAYVLKTNWEGFYWPLFKKMFVFAYPFIFGLVAFWVMDWADRVILTQLTDLNEVGLYNLGYSLGMAIMLPVGAFSTAWVPFYMSFAQKEEAPRVYSLAMTYYSLIIGFFVLVLSVFGRDYFYFFTPEQFHGAHTVIPLVALAYALKGNFTIAAVGAFLKKKTHLELFTDILATVINIVAMFILIPYLGRLGAAWATFAAYLALPLSMYLLSFKLFPIKYEWWRLAQIAIVGVILYYFAQLIYEPTLNNVLLRLSLVILYPIIFLLIGFFHSSEIQKLKQIFKKVFSKEVNEPVIPQS